MKARFKLSHIFISIIRLVLPLAACGLSVVCGSGNLQNEARPVSGFEVVTLSGSGSIS